MELSARVAEEGDEEGGSDLDRGGLPHSISVGGGMSQLERSGTYDMELARMEAGDGRTSEGTKPVAESGGGRAGTVGARGLHKPTGGGDGIMDGSDSRSSGCGGGVSSGSAGNKKSVGTLGSLKRGVGTTGDLVSLQRERKAASNFGSSRWAKRARPGTNTTAGGVFWIAHPPETRTGLPRGRLGRTDGFSGMVRRRSEGNSLAHIQQDIRPNVERSFRVLGLEIGHLPESQQFLFCAGGVFTFLLVYGYMQVRARSLRPGLTAKV